MTINILLSVLLSFGVNSSSSLGTSFSVKELLKTAAMAKPKSKSKIKKKRFRWKRIFRPIKIFKKKISYWWFLFFGIASVLGISFYFLDRSNISLDGALYRAISWLFLSVFSLSVLIVLVILITLPIIFIVRILKELKWNKRYRKCFKF